MKRGLRMNSMGHQARILGGSALFALMIVSATASAQDSSEEIIVTAAKREQSINSVGMSITAVSGDQLLDRGIRETADLVKLVPGLSASQSINNTPIYTLRGIGFNEAGLATSPSVSIYVDEIPLALNSETVATSLDLERVEVLKGPQGILFGQNATGGAINFIAAKPTETFKTGFTASYARFDVVDLSGFLSGPLTDTVRARLSVRGVHGGDWQYSTTRPGDSLGSTRQLQRRLLLDWDATDRLRFGLNLNGWIDRSDVVAGQLVMIGEAVPGFTPPGFTDLPLAPRRNRAADWSPDWPMDRDDKFYQIALRGEYDLSDAITLTSITAFNHFKGDSYQDVDATPFRNIDSRVIGSARTFYQELRFAGSMNDIEWILGANYQRISARETTSQYLADISTIRFLTNAFFGRDPLRSVSSNMRNPQIANTYAVFANVDYPVAPDLTLQLGARYTKAKRSVESCNYDGGGELAAIFNLLKTGGPALGDGDCVTLTDGIPGVFRDRMNEDNVSWRIGLNYEPAAGALIYANATQGYKAGTYPSLAASESLQLAGVTQERVRAYETGFKLALMDRVLNLNGAFFYYDYKDKQLRGRVLDPTFGLLERLANIPKSHVYGVEAQVGLRPIQGLSLDIGATWLKAKVDRFIGLDGTGAPADFKGFTLPESPKWSVVADGQYKTALTEDWDVFLGASLSYHGKAFSAFDERSIMAIDAYTLIDLRLGVETADRKWKVTLFGQNVTDEYYWTSVFQGIDGYRRLTGRPATYGISIGYQM